MTAWRHQIASVLVSVLCVLANAQDRVPLYPAGTLYSYGNSVDVYPEGFVLLRGQQLLVDGKTAVTLAPDRGTEEIVLTDREGRFVRELIRLVTTKASDLTDVRRVPVLCLGESTTKTVNPDPRTGSYDAGWNWVSMMKSISGVQGIDLACLGTTTRKGASPETCCTAHGGWSSYTYLNWPCAAKMDPGAPAHFFRSEEMWYALGLQGVTGKAFTKEAWQYDLMASTPFGKYPVDTHPALLAFAESVSGQYGFPILTGSVQAWADELARNPVNEFYSLDAAKKGSSAFSFETYLERYRTLDDEGNRLESARDNPSSERVRGKDGKRYRIGTRIVSQALLKTVSVCRPAYVVVNVGINDGDSASSIAATARSMESLLECFPGIPTAHFVMRWPGACDPGLWAPAYRPRQYSVNGNNERVMAIMTTVSAWAADRSDIDLLDVWHCQSPVSQHQEKYENGVLDCSLDDVHTGYDGQLSAAHQVLGWLFYRLGSIAPQQPITL